MIAAEQRYLTPAEVAERLGFSRRTIYSWLRSGRLPAVKIGPRHWRIAPVELEILAIGREAGRKPAGRASANRED